MSDEPSQGQEKPVGAKRLKTASTSSPNAAGPSGEPPMPSEREALRECVEALKEAIGGYIQQLHGQSTVGYCDGAETAVNVTRWRSALRTAEAALQEESASQKHIVATGDGWTEWKGGECPVEPTVRVTVRLRRDTLETYAAYGFSWEHSATNPENDIIAYREAALSPPEGGEGDIDEPYLRTPGED